MKNQGQYRATQIHVLFLALIAITVVGAFALAWMHKQLPQKQSGAVDLLTDYLLSGVHPEPTERFVFSVLAAAIPTLALLLTLRPFPRVDSHGIAVTVLPLLVAALLFLPLFGSEFAAVMIGKFERSTSSRRAALLASLALSAIYCLAVVRFRISDTRRHPATTWTAWLLMCAACCLQLFAWRFVSINSVTSGDAWRYHADPLFYVISQVAVGKTLLVDLPSQYGLFPEVLGPLFRAIGSSVRAIGATFAALQLLGTFALFFVLHRIIRSRALLTVAGFALVLVTFETVLFIPGFDERYLQYWPIRFFWPAASVLAFYLFTLKPSMLRVAMLSALSAVALLWNLDSGLFVAVAFGAFLLARAALPGPSSGARAWTAKRYLSAAVLHTATAIAVSAAFLFMLHLKSGQPLRFDWLIDYPLIFSEIGLAMLPMPLRVDPWMSLLGVYVLALVVAFNEWRSEHSAEGRVRSDVLFFLGMLGLGLFVYYAGRSHVLNLVTVCWPAVLIIAILSEQMLQMVRDQLLPKIHLILPTAGIAALLLSAGTFAFNAPKFALAAVTEFSHFGIPDDPLVMDEIALIKRHTKPGDECLIVSHRQGIYFAETGLRSAFKGPGLIEALLKSDEAGLTKRLFSGDVACVFVGAGPTSAPKMRVDLNRLLERYAVADQSPGGTLLYLQPKE